ncbi:MFS transporter [Paenactinomyces guangxiensis]|uniref:MFS transporter n=1 Tax=Paenactinomyces guangxiensis TaxID=1490290 RepID=A0A7W1WUS8_9BACL|nr:MFS transporter [Paenactinomyces guangxiensis]MBA4496454.1 MFS transporter [Paenactinomyces guangxiensis]MBH8593570.1 MFS transporter [Paenactinomyces guangxiensis]
MNLRSNQIGVLFIVWTAFLLSFVDRLSWPPVIPIASHDLGISAAQAGGYMTAFYIGYVCTQLPGGLLTDRFGYRKVLLSSFLIMGVFTALMGTIHSYGQGFVLRVLAGFGSGAVFSACVRAIFDWFPGKGRSTAMGLFMTASSLGVSVVNLFVPSVAESYSWKTSFFVAGLLPLIGFSFGFWFLKERTPVHQQRQSQTPAEFWKNVASLLKNRNLMLTWLSGFCAMWATWGTATWANTYINKALHLSLAEAGAIMSIYGITAILCKPIIGICSEFIRSKKILLFWLLVTFAPMLLWFGSNKNVHLLYVLAGILGISAFVYSPVVNNFIGELVDRKQIGTATGLVNTIWQLGSLLSPLAVGSVLDQTHNYFYAFGTLALGPVLAAIIILFVKERGLEKEHQIGTEAQA